MTGTTAILRYLLDGQATADALSESLSMHPETVAGIIRNQLSEGGIEEGAITIKGKRVLSVFRLTPKTRQNLTAPTTN